MLPEALLLLLHSSIVFAQSRQQLSLNTVARFSTLNQPFFVIPSVATQATVSVALCIVGSSPRFFVSNSSTSDSPGSAGGPDVFEIPLDEGQGSWTGGFPNGGVLGVENAGQTSFEVGLSDNGTTVFIP